MSIFLFFVVVIHSLLLSTPYFFGYSWSICARIAWFRLYFAIFKDQNMLAQFILADVGTIWFHSHCLWLSTLSFTFFSSHMYFLCIHTVIYEYNTHTQWDMINIFAIFVTRYGVCGLFWAARSFNAASISRLVER